ncbi:Thioesterase/thiol ester dehydrase-isomerase [Hypoxylon sp. FL1150]|nr:Thioesterase/thiol ester dehydrase-isomerase [Hypoxylon sp. FL1150]
MGQISPVESYIAVSPAPDLGTDVYINEKRYVSLKSRVSQAISAATATVSPDFHVYSSQSTFARPMSDKAEGRVNYHVERTADGRTYATRLVRAMAGGACVYIAVVSLQSAKGPAAAGSALTYHVPMPEMDEGKPFDWRPCGHILEDHPTESIVRAFLRAQPLSTRSPSAHLAGLSYASDESFLGVAIFASPQEVGPGGKNVAMVGSLNHNISFHDPAVQVDEWMMCVRRTSWGGDGRVLIHQHMWDLKSGRLVMTAEQEALVRLKISKTKL